MWEAEAGKDKKHKNAGVPIEITESNGIIHQAFTLPSTHTSEESDGISEFFFTIEKLDCIVQGTLKAIEANNEYVLMPTNKVAYLYVGLEKKITSLKIYETGNKLHTGIVKYGDTVTVKIATRNYIGKNIIFHLFEDVKVDNHTDQYSMYDKMDDQDMSVILHITIDAEGNGEEKFIIPKSWENNHKVGKEGIPRYFYLKSGDLEFPQAYYNVLLLKI